MPFTDINTAVCATVRKLRNIYLKAVTKRSKSLVTAFLFDVVHNEVRRL